MKKIALASPLLVVAAALGCDGEADIGIDRNPVTCTSNGPSAEVRGTVTDPFTGTSHEFGAAGAGAVPTDTGGAVVTIGDDSLILRFGFYCATRTPGTYDLVGDTQNPVNCPIEVAGMVGGRVEYLPAESGVLIVDESSNCMAGRFRADFGEHGELTGWFSAPWTSSPR